MTYQLVWTKRAADDMKLLPLPVQRGLSGQLKSLAEFPTYLSEANNFALSDRSQLYACDCESEDSIFDLFVYFRYSQDEQIIYLQGVDSVQSKK